MKAHQAGDNKLDEAEAAYTEGLTLSRAKSAKGFELICATGLAQLWATQDKKKQAHDLLAPVYDWFTEGFDTKDLREAKALLEQLSQGRQ